MATEAAVVTFRGERLHWQGRRWAPLPRDPSRTRIEVLRNGIVLATVGLYLMFNWGFMQLRVPPVAGGGLPVGEIVLLLCLATFRYTRVLGSLAATVQLLPFAVWWSFGVGRALFDFMAHGAWALRDAAHVLESLFLLVGFVVAADRRSFDRFFAWLPILLALSTLYGLLYPVRVQIWAISPTITTGTGFEAPIFGTMATAPFLMIVAAAYLILFHGNRLLANVGAVLILGYTIAIFQQRTLYLILIAVFGLLIFYRRATFGHLAIIVYGGALGLALIMLSGLQFEGRLGATLSFDFLAQHFLAIFGVSSTEYNGIASAASGVGQRLDWWENIFQSMLADPFSLLLGLGYGVPLTEFSGSTGAIVREPHNSYISVIARTGVVGGVCWVLIMLTLFRNWHRTMLACRARGWRTGENRLLILMVYFLCIWMLAIGEDGFEKPYNIIPFYFFWGIVLRFGLLLARGEIGPVPPTAPPSPAPGRPPCAAEPPRPRPAGAPSPHPEIVHLLADHRDRRGPAHPPIRGPAATKEP